MKVIIAVITSLWEMRRYDNYSSKFFTVYGAGLMFGRWHDWLIMPEHVKDSLRHLRAKGRPCSWRRIWDGDRVGTGPPYEIGVGGKPSDSGGVTFR